MLTRPQSGRHMSKARPRPNKCKARSKQDMSKRKVNATPYCDHTKLK